MHRLNEDEGREARPIREEIYHRLKQDIISGRCSEGTRLVEAELAEQMQVSRTPVREAIRKLESDGLVEALPRRGVVVTSLKASDIIEIYRIRQALEVLAFQAASERITDEELAAVHLCLERSKIHLAEGNCQAFYDDSESFTDLMVLACKMPRVIQLIDTYRVQLRRFRRVTLSRPLRQKQALEEHLAIFGAVTARDVERVGYLVRDHLDHALEVFWKSHGGSFGGIG